MINTIIMKTKAYAKARRQAQRYKAKLSIRDFKIYGGLQWNYTIQ